MRRPDPPRKCYDKPDIATSIRSDGTPAVSPACPCYALACFEIGFAPPGPFARDPALVFKKFDFAQLALPVTVLKSVVVDEAHKARTTVTKWQCGKHVRERALDKGVGDGERDKAANEKQRAKGNYRQEWKSEECA